MTATNVIAEATAYLEERWSALPIVQPNTRKAITPSDGSAYVLIQLPYSTSSRRTVGAPGSNIYREEGGLRFVINVVRGSGIEEGFAWAEEIAAIFRGKEFQGIQTFAPSSPVFDDANENGNYFVLSFAVPYQLDRFG